MTPEPSPLLLGLDVGSSRIKALLLDVDGQDVGGAQVPTPFAASDAGTEAEAPAIVDALVGALSKLGEGRERVVAVGIAGIAESGVPLDGSGRPLASVIAWHDRRGEDVAARLADRFGPSLHRGIGQRLRYVATVAKLGWLLEHGVPIPARWLGVPELTLHALTGVEATEGSLAGRTGCRSVVDGRWLPDVAEAAGFSVDIFPEVGHAGDALGTVSAQGAARFGLRPGIPVTIAGHDHLVGLVGSGTGAADFADSVGTAETVLCYASELPDLDQTLDRSLAVGVFPGGRGWGVLAGAARSGLAVEAAAASLGLSPRELDDLVTEAPLLEAPDLAASLERREDPALPDGPPGRVWATLLDVLAGFTASAVDQVSAVAGPPDRLVVFGGGAQSRPWLAAKARHVDVPVWRSGAGEAVARGAALFAGVTAGWWSAWDTAPKPQLEPC